jgi:hypothetical protein
LYQVHVAEQRDGKGSFGTLESNAGGQLGGLANETGPEEQSRLRRRVGEGLVWRLTLVQDRSKILIIPNRNVTVRNFEFGFGQCGGAVESFGLSAA